MTTFLLLPGAGGEAWFWHLVVAELEALGHEAIAVDLPADDESLGWAEFTTIALDALGSRSDPVVVGQSMGAFLAPLVCSKVRALHLILVNPMIPRPGETAGEWWGNTGMEAARVAAGFEGFDVDRDFFHDVPADLVAVMAQGGRNQSEHSFADPYPLASWPAVPTTVIAGRDDRFFPLEFVQRIAQERLGLESEVVPGGHLNALSQPKALAAALAAHA